MRLLVLLNAQAGTFAASQVHASEIEPTEHIRRTFAERGVEAVVRRVETGRLADEARAAAADDFDGVVAGGGDGTLNAIASALAGSSNAFAVLPLGTHNHFAKDLHLPMELDAAIEAIARGAVRDLDVAEVNGRLFLNFSGIGFHPRLIERREAVRRRSGLHKFLAMAVAFFQVLRHVPLLRVQVTGGRWEARRLTPSVIVCNNAHQMKVFGVEEVSHPDRGMLNVYVARARGAAGLVRLVLAALFRRLGSLRDFEVIVLPEVRVDVPRRRRRRIRVSIDGELTDLDLPLNYRIRRGGLKVIVPAGIGQAPRPRGGMAQQ